MIDISFKNRTGIKPEMLSAVIGADSFFYGLFSEDYELLESKWYSISDFSDEKIIEEVKFDIYSIEGLSINVSASNKPYLHSPIPENDQVLECFPAFKNKNIEKDKFTALEVYVDYGLSKNQSEFLSRVLNGNATKFHLSTVLSNYCYPYREGELLAFVENDSLHLLYGKDQKFVFYNQFHCSNAKDYLYFVALAFDELGLDYEKDTLILSGRVDFNSPIFTLVREYFRNVEFMRSAKLNVTDLRFRARQHYYLDLYATALCV